MESELYMKSSRVLEDAINQETNATHHFLTAQASLFDGKRFYWMWVFVIRQAMITDSLNNALSFIVVLDAS